MINLDKKAKEYADDFYSNELEDEKLLFKKADIRLAYKQGFEDGKELITAEEAKGIQNKVRSAQDLSDKEYEEWINCELKAEIFHANYSTVISSFTMGKNKKEAKARIKLLKEAGYKTEILYEDEHCFSLLVKWA